MSRRLSAPAAALIAALLAVMGVTGCSPENLTPKTVKSETSEFCRALGQEFDLRDLRSAIERNDAEAIAASLQRLDDLLLKAPADISADLRKVVTAVEDTVRAVTQVGAEGTDPTPVDVASLDARLAKISTSSQKVVAYADENCGIKLSQQ